MNRQYERRPTDHKLSPLATESLADAQLYVNLREAEKRLDTLITRKRLDLQDVIGRSMRRNKTLRIFVSSSIQNAPWQTGDPDSAAFDFGLEPETKEPTSWNLRIEGRLVDDDKGAHRLFSSMFTSIIVELTREEDDSAMDVDFPINEVLDQNGQDHSAQTEAGAGTGDGQDGAENKKGGPSEVVEWHEVPPHSSEPRVDFDGLDVRRRGDSPVKVKIIMQLKEYPDKFKLSPALSDMLGISEESKPGVVVSLWQYIRFHKLQDVDEKRLIKCDTALKSLFNRDTVTFPQLVELLAPHLQPREPIVIEYTVDPTQQLDNRDIAFDVPLQVDDPLRQDLIAMLDSWLQDQSLLRQLDEQVLQDVQHLNLLAQQRSFYEQLAADPNSFLDKWVASQAHDLKIIYSDRQFSEEAVRHSSFYNSEALNQSIHLFLNTK